MAIHRYTVEYSAIIPSGSICSNPTITPINPTACITIPCYNDDSFDFEINTEDNCEHCITFLIDCSEGCSSCGTIEVTKCFCVDSDDCGGCESCSGNICISSCAEGKVCDNETCVDCTEDSDCLCNGVCAQGSCKCPSGLKKRADGCCVECLDGEDLGNCLICINGTIVAVDCPDGHCNPNTGDCQECYNNSHCDGVNECCNAQGSCDCCPGFILDPVTNQCIEKPECFNAQDCIDQFGKCYYCGPDGCTPIVCPEGFICDPNTGECVPECDGVCPEGYGCINGICVPCSELSCTGTGLQCQFAEGCHCVGTACEWIDCNLDNVELEWKVTTGTQGQIDPNNPGLPNLAGTTSISPTGLVHEQSPNGSTYMNHQFNLAITNGTSGTFTLYNTPTNSIVLGSGVSTSFSLQSTGPNLVGFIVKFVETGTGRTATWGLFRTPTAPLTAPDVWNYEFQSTGKPAGTIGGTSGSVQLCSNNLNFIPTGVTNVVTTGTLSVTFISNGAGCLTAYITGCGTWNGDVTALCGGQTITIPAPELSIDESTCCDITDPTCDGWGTGDPCQDLTIQPITLVALPTYGSTGSGDGEFLIVADWTSAGLSFIDLFYLDPADGCWSTANNPAASSNDVQIVTSAAQSPLGPSVSNLSVVATLGDGGCVRLGYTCELKIAGCKKLQGEVCLTECQAFTVDILSLGDNVYKAMPSIQDEAVTYTWSYPGLNNITSQTVTIVPVGGTTTLIVTAKYGSPVKCTASDSLVLNTTVPGCTNSSACNYNSSANVDDGSCVFVPAPTYDCALGFLPGATTHVESANITYRANGVFKVQNDKLDPGTYSITVYVNGVLASRCSHTLTVPQCYNCASSVCTPAPSGSNTGVYSTSNCDNACGCAIDINVDEICADNRTTLIISATGDSGTYTVIASEVGGTTVLPLTGLSTGSTLTIPNLCNGNYTITVTGDNCSKTVTYTANCFVCGDSDLALTDASINCAGNYAVTVTLTGDVCADSYRLEVLDPDLNVVGTMLKQSGGTYSIPLGTYPGDGIYFVRVTDIPNNNCVTATEFIANCNGTLTECPITSSVLQWSQSGALVSFTESFTLSEAGGTYLVSLHYTTGGTPSNCNNATLSDVQIGGTQTITGVAGVNTVNFINVLSVPPVPTCFGVRILRQGNAACIEEDIIQVNPLSAPSNCGIVINSTTFNSATEQVVVGWDGTDTSGDLTIEINAYPSAVCGTGTPVTFTQSGLGEDSVGNVSFGNFPQLEGQIQCVSVEIYDTNDPSCAISTTFQIGSCTCAIEILSTEVEVDLEQITIEYRTKCTSGDITIDITGDATGSSSDSTASTDGVWITNSKVVSLASYPPTDGTITVEITDDNNAGCTVTLEVELEGNCTPCAQTASLYLNTSTVTQIRNQSGVQIVAGSYAVLADEAELEEDLESEIVSDGGNFCDGTVPVDVANSRNAGIAVNQDNENFQNLDYALVESPDWAGTRKFYFGDCGCDIARRCDYTVALPITADSSRIVVSFNGNNALADYTEEFSFEIDTPQTFSPTTRANLESQLLDALRDGTCAANVSDVTVTYNDGTDVLTIVVEGTNAGLGAFRVQSISDSIEAVVEFTQSNCS
jgi:hypothetical protein